MGNKMTCLEQKAPFSPGEQQRQHVGGQNQDECLIPVVHSATVGTEQVSFTNNLNQDIYLKQRKITRAYNYCDCHGHRLREWNVLLTFSGKFKLSKIYSFLGKTGKRKSE